MIPLDKLRAITRVVTHANCPDGVASALIVKDALPDVRVSFVRYDSAEHQALVPEPGVLFADFSPWLPPIPDPDEEEKYKERAWEERLTLLRRWTEAGAIVLDHHPTRRDVTEEFAAAGLGVFGLNEKNECGAWLAYEHVWKPLLEADRGLAVPAWGAYMGAAKRFAELAAIRDTWKSKDPRWDDAMQLAELQLFWRMKRPVSYYFEDNRVLAEHLFEKKLDAARTSLDEAHVFVTSKKTRVRMFQGVATTSDATELVEIAEKEGDSQLSGGHLEISRTALVVGFHYAVDAGKLKLQFSMRSHTGYDVGAFAAHHGGGGHKAAAGFTIEVSRELSGNPYELFITYLEMWEAR